MSEQEDKKVIKIPQRSKPTDKLTERFSKFLTGLLFVCISAVIVVVTITLILWMMQAW